jgi:DNA-binding transcriptional ArsR family regulator
MDMARTVADTASPSVVPWISCLNRQPHPIIYNHMVVGDLTTEAIDDLFHALADPTRRDIIRRAAAGEPSVSRLAQAYPMSFAAVQKHVAVLERAGLVTKQRRGREQLVRTDAGAVGRARQALDELEATWRGRVDRMSDLLAPGTE